MNDNTVPIPEPEVTVLAPLKANMGNVVKSGAGALKEASTAISDYIKPSLIRYPQYDYKTGKQWFLSKTEKIVVDAYLKTNNASEACRALNAIRGAHGSTKFYDIRAVNRWLKKPHVAQHVAQGMIDQGKVNWLTQPKWEAWGVDVMEAKFWATQVQVAVWKEFGKAKGWYKESGPQVQNNTQINFVQSDGKA